jgi:hypothetical protein
MLRSIPFPAVLRRFAFVAALALAPSAGAHEVWIEDTPEGKLVVRFAEYGDKYEQSPGALDAMTLPFAWTPAEAADSKALAASVAGKAPAAEARAILDGQVKTFEVQKKSDGFLLVEAAKDKVAQIETGFTVMGKPGNPEKPARKPHFYARWQPAGGGAGQPGLNFDIVPTGKQGEARVYFRGKPMAGVKVKFYPPAEAEKELTADAEGFVRFEATKPGLYLLAGARHREEIAGFFGGKPFDVTSHNCSLAWRQP